MSFESLPLSEDFDRDLLLRVKQFMDQRGCAAHRSLKVTVERGVVVVQGRTPSFYIRQTAVECLKRVAGVAQVVDQIEVADCPDHRRSSGPSEDEQEPTLLPKRRRADPPKRKRTAIDASQADASPRDLVSDVKGHLPC